MVWIGTTPAAVDKSMTGGIHAASTDFNITKLPVRHHKPKAKKTIDHIGSIVVKTNTPRRYAPTVRHGLD
jgi:hypothetical protein